MWFIYIKIFIIIIDYFVLVKLVLIILFLFVVFEEEVLELVLLFGVEFLLGVLLDCWYILLLIL